MRDVSLSDKHYKEFRQELAFYNSLQTKIDKWLDDLERAEAQFKYNGYSRYYEVPQSKSYFQELLKMQRASSLKLSKLLGG